MELLRLHVVINGRVQGVSFRYHTKLKADDLQITGWVLNRRDGAVETLAEGTENQLAVFQKYLWQVPPLARVDTIESLSNAPATGEFSGFNIRYYTRPM